MLDIIKKQIRLKALNFYRNSWKSYIRHKYGVKADICFIYSHNYKELFYMTDTHQGTCAVSYNACKYIRKECGENKLMQYGIPESEDKTPYLVLIPTLSMLQAMGPLKFGTFLKDWPGDSKVGETIVMKYSIMQ
jgi:hypothetical protein